MAENSTTIPAEIVPADVELPAELANPGTSGMLVAGDARHQLEAYKEIAGVLADFVAGQGLARSFGRGRRPYVQVEGWQFLGTMLGITVLVEWTRKTSPHRPPTFTTEGDSRRLVEEGEGGWEARAVAKRIGTEVVVGAGEAECLWMEANWRTRDSYALRSMAQTRAISKALRGPLSFVMVMGGYAATPAEEMDGVASSLEAESPPCPSCGGPTWDNRAKNVQRVEQGKKALPAYKCRDEDGCGWITWSASEFDGEDPDVIARRVNGAKSDLLEAIGEAGAITVASDLNDPEALADTYAAGIAGLSEEKVAHLNEMLASDDPERIGQAAALIIYRAVFRELELDEETLTGEERRTFRMTVRGLVGLEELTDAEIEAAAADSPYGY